MLCTAKLPGRFGAASCTAAPCSSSNHSPATARAVAAPAPVFFPAPPLARLASTPARSRSRSCRRRGGLELAARAVTGPGAGAEIDSRRRGGRCPFVLPHADHAVAEADRHQPPQVSMLRASQFDHAAGRPPAPLPPRGPAAGRAQGGGAAGRRVASTRGCARAGCS